MVVIDWLQTSEFIRANSERFILYCLCGCFIGIAVIFLTVIIVLFMEQRENQTEEDEVPRHTYQVPRPDGIYNDILATERPYPSVYHYNERSQSEIYHI
ncbi:unnamed protein product [Adineta ricciae]|uniref:Uncharacterized protein n=1 Tax=Adineta ricciae TaxID=249248 RepID=A0A816CKH6_ADIRI|nr:unnamed protein product [Adineta ricciae]